MRTQFIKCQCMDGSCQFCKLSARTVGKCLSEALELLQREKNQACIDDDLSLIEAIRRDERIIDLAWQALESGDSMIQIIKAEPVVVPVCPNCGTRQAEGGNCMKCLLSAKPETELEKALDYLDNALTAQADDDVNAIIICKGRDIKVLLAEHMAKEISFVRFQCSKRSVSDSPELLEAFREQFENPTDDQNGFAYLGSYFIEVLDGGEFQLVIENQIIVSADLESLERKLFEWHYAG